MRAILRLSFVLVLLALLPFPLYALTGDEALVIRLVSGLVVVTCLSEIVAPRFDMANWPGRNWLASAAADSTFALASPVDIFPLRRDSWNLRRGWG